VLPLALLLWVAAASFAAGGARPRARRLVLAASSALCLLFAAKGSLWLARSLGAGSPERIAWSARLNPVCYRPALACDAAAGEIPPADFPWMKARMVSAAPSDSPAQP
jgi:hypothetical protein